METIKIRSEQRVEMINISKEIEAYVKSTGVREGLCTVFLPHTTAGVTINEDADPDVQHDMIMELNKIVPFNDGYHHYEGNSAAHLKASLTGSSVTMIIDQGKLVLGTWQGVYFCEYDGPRIRKVHIKVIEG